MRISDDIPSLNGRWMVCEHWLDRHTSIHERSQSGSKEVLIYPPGTRAAFSKSGDVGGGGGEAILAFGARTSGF